MIIAVVERLLILGDMRKVMKAETTVPRTYRARTAHVCGPFSLFSIQYRTKFIFIMVTNVPYIMTIHIFSKIFKTKM